LQVKLLTAIESQQVRRLGSTRNEPVDVWIIAATSVDLATAMRAGRFRRELYHRLSTVVLELPPLRHRQRDVLDLADHFLGRAAAEHQIPFKQLAEDARSALLAYPWPGNVRELANVLERVMLLEDSPVITAAMLSLLEPAGGSTPDSLQSPEALRADERQQLVTALNAARGNITRAAARLGIHRNTMRYRLTKHGLSTHDAAPAASAEPRENGDALSSAPPTPAPANTIRWEERLVAVLGATIAVSVGGSAFELAGVMTELIEMVTSFGARIEQFTPSELVAVFGIEPMEDAPRRAVLASHAMLQALRRSEDKKHGRFAIHLGSYLIARAGAVTGMDAHARRRATDAVSALLQQAGPGEVVVDAAAASFVDRHFATEPLGDGPADLARIVGRERPRFEVGGRTLSHFVGRAPDVETLHALMGRVEAGEAHIVGLLGEPGVGKSRLVFELTHSHRVTGWLVLEAAAVSHGAATSYLPVTDLLRRYFRISDRDAPRDIREKVTGRLLTLDRALEPALPALLALLDVTVEDPRWQGLDPSQRRQRTLDAVKRLLRREAQVQPLLVVFEDLHWIDTETRILLDSLADSLATTPMLLLMTYRPEYRHACDVKTNYTQIRLDPLPPESADELLDALLGGDTSLDPLKHLLVGTTGRNPLFIEESVRTLVETEGLAGERGAYRLAQPVDMIQVPATVQAIIAARIDRLPADEKRMIETAAVVGKDVSFALLQAIVDDGEETLRQRLNHLQVAEFLHETHLSLDLEYTFKHALTHEVAYNGVLPERRRALHGRIAEAIEQLHAGRLIEHVERLAHHTVKGEVWEKAVHYLRQAGLKAFARSAPREARGWFEQALGVLETLPESQSALEQAFEIRLELRPMLSQLGEARRGLARLREAETLAERLNDDRRRGRVSAVLTNAHSLLGEMNEALVTGTRALEFAGRLRDLRLRILTTTQLEQAHYYRGDYQRVVELATDNLAALPADSDYEHFGSALPASIYDRYWLVRSLAHLGRFDEAAQYAAEALGLAEPTQRASTVGLAHFAAGRLHLLKGDWAKARALFERGIAVLRTGNNVLSLPHAVASSAWVLAQVGEASEALTRLREGEELLERQAARGIVDQHGADYHSLGLAALLLGRLDEARGMGDRALKYSPSHPGFAAHALHLLGDIATHPDRFDAESGEAHYRQGLALAEPRGMRPLVAHCHRGLGTLYRRAGKPQQAGAHLVTATTMYREMDMPCWLEAAEAELRRAK
jgi:tetratricopeptide (TPR) repeat protein